MPNTTQNQNMQSQYTQQYQPAEKPPFHFLDSKMIIPLLVIILVILAAMIGAYFWKTMGSKSSETVKDNIAPAATENEKECSGIDVKTVTGNDRCVFDIAKKYNSPSFCSKMLTPSGPFSTDSCYEYFAVKQGDSSLCNVIKQYMGNNSFHSCMFQVALKTSNPELCTFLSAEEADYTFTRCLGQLNLTEGQFDALHTV